MTYMSLDLVAAGDVYCHAALTPADRALGAFSPLERRVIALARHDSLASIRPAGPLTRALRAIFKLPQPNRLADRRLEALRRMAVLYWHGLAEAGGDR